MYILYVYAKVVKLNFCYNLLQFKKPIPNQHRFLDFTHFQKKSFLFPLLLKVLKTIHRDKPL